MSSDASHVRDASPEYRAGGESRLEPLRQEPTGLGVAPTDWEVSSIGAQFSVQLGKMLDAAKNIGVPKPYLGNRAIQWNRIDLAEADSVPMTDSDMQRYRLQPGDLLVCEGGEIGRAAIWDAPISECYYQKALHRLRPKSGFDPYLLMLFLELWTSAGKLANYVTQTSIAHLPKDKLELVPLPVPPPAEQRAIAEALSDVDDLLGALDALIAKKRAIKQAAMQQLLTGKTRLPGFSGNWGASCIGAEFHVQLGKMLDAAKNSGELKPYLGNRSVQWGRIDLSELAEARLTDTDVKRLRLRKGDLLVCEGGEVGRAAIWNDELSECYYQKALHRLRPRGSFDPYLMQLLLEFWASTGGFDAFVTRTSIAHLPKDKLEIIPLPVPSVEEQSAIVTVLVEFESEIAALERRRDKTRAIKQGMMQQLLTGRVRLMPPSAATNEAATS